MRHLGRLIVALVLSVGLYIFPATAQAQDRPGRRTIEKAVPFYPDIAKRSHMKGVVKMEVVVRPDGSVKSIKVLGGNPVFVESATNAVRHWKYQPAAEETTEAVHVEFEPR